MVAFFSFTPVCTTELGQVALHAEEFRKRGVKLVGFSVSNVESHKSWIKDIEAATGGIVDFPLFADCDRRVSRSIELLDWGNLGDEGLPLSIRGVYILRPNKSIALVMAYPSGTGRNMAEIVRVCDSILRSNNNNQVSTPVNWQPGQDVLVNASLSNADADAQFGPNGYRIIPLPSEQGRSLTKNYLRFTKDPIPIVENKSPSCFAPPIKKKKKSSKGGGGGSCVIS